MQHNRGSSVEGERSLEALYPAVRPRLVVILERLEEVGGGLGPLALRHVHLAAALADDAHDARVRNGGLDGQRLLVQLLAGRVGWNWGQINISRLAGALNVTYGR